MALSSTDNLDIASEHEQMFRDQALRARKPTGPVATGKCLCCDEPLSEGLRWCDALCRDDWQKDQR